MNPFEFVSWNYPLQEVSREDANKFLLELEELYKKHNISISHEDFHGAFILDRFDEQNLEWIKKATIKQPDNGTSTTSL